MADVDLSGITFAERDPSVIESQVITLQEKFLSVEGQTPVKFYPADPRRLMALGYVAMITLLRNDIDRTAKMNTLYFAVGEYLDLKGFDSGVTRLEASYATTTLRYELSAPQPQAVIIPAGTRATPDGNIYFATTETVEIPAGETSADVTAQCSVAGTSGNGWTPGQINQEVDRIVWVKSVTNITASSGGADAEDDENYRTRIQMAPESFSVAGPKGAYAYHVRSVNQSIVDVAVLGPDDSTAEHIIEPGNVEIYPLMSGGELPSQDILDAVYEACGTDNDVRPDTDYVHVLPPDPAAYDVDVTYWIDRGNATLAASIQTAVEAAVEGWVLWQRSKLGRDINPSELTRRMVVAGAKRVEIASPVFRALCHWQLAAADNIAVRFGGLEDG